MAIAHGARARVGFAALVVALALSADGSRASAQSAPGRHETVSAEGEDHTIVFELGAAADWSRGESIHPGGTFAFEVTPIEHWLELEFGWTAIHGGATTEMPIDVLFKKPWQVSRSFEFMVGAGPEWIYATGAERGNYWGVNAVLDLMFWPARDVGWYVEPGYEATFHNGTHHALGIALGLLIGR